MFATLTMYKYVGVGLVGLFFMMIIPSGLNTIQDDGLNLYGAATIDVSDVDGNSVFTQTVHNNLFDEGEAYLLTQVFKVAGASVTDTVRIGAICLSSATLETAENTANTLFNSNHLTAQAGGDGSSKNCKSATVTVPGGIATIGPITFTALDNNAGNLFAPNTVTHIGVCDADAANADALGCTTTLFAVADTSNVAMITGETVEVTYTFDITDDAS